MSATQGEPLRRPVVSAPLAAREGAVGTAAERGLPRGGDAMTTQSNTRKRLAALLLAATLLAAAPATSALLDLNQAQPVAGEGGGGGVGP